MRDRFDAAVEFVQALPVPTSKLGAVFPPTSNDFRLKLYGLFKQATIGACNTRKPAFYDVVATYKWNAWNELGQMSSATAMRTYLDMVIDLLEANPIIVDTTSPENLPAIRALSAADREDAIALIRKSRSFLQEIKAATAATLSSTSGSNSVLAESEASGKPNQGSSKRSESALNLYNMQSTAAAAAEGAETRTNYDEAVSPDLSRNIIALDADDNEEVQDLTRDDCMDSPVHVSLSQVGSSRDSDDQGADYSGVGSPPLLVSGAASKSTSTAAPRRAAETSAAAKSPRKAEGEVTPASLVSALQRSRQRSQPSGDDNDEDGEEQEEEDEEEEGEEDHVASWRHARRLKERAAPDVQQMIALAASALERIKTVEETASRIIGEGAGLPLQISSGSDDGALIAAALIAQPPVGAASVGGQTLGMSTAPRSAPDAAASDLASPLTTSLSSPSSAASSLQSSSSSSSVAAGSIKPSTAVPVRFGPSSNFGKLSAAQQQGASSTSSATSSSSSKSPSKSIPSSSALSGSSVPSFPASPPNPAGKNGGRNRSISSLFGLIKTLWGTWLGKLCLILLPLIAIWLLRNGKRLDLRKRSIGAPL